MAKKSATKRIHIDVISQQITEVFERILSEVTARRDELLAQVDKLRIDFEAKSASVMENIKGLKEMRAYTRKMPVKLNLAVKKQRESLADIDSDIENLKKSLISDSNLEFNHSIDQLIEQVRQFGEVFDNSFIITKYQSKLSSVQVISGTKDIQFSKTTKLHVDHEQQLLYLLQISKNQQRPRNSFFELKFDGYIFSDIAVCNASHFTVITTINIPGNPVTYMATGDKFIYLASNNQLFQYKKDYTFLKKCQVTYGVSILDICLTSENLLIALCYSRNTYKFLVYDSALNYKKEIYLILSYQIPDLPQNIKTFVRSEQFYILMKKQLLVFTKEGNRIQLVEFNKAGKQPVLKNPTSFCIDEVGNIIIIDSATNSIKFFSPEGDLFHKIGEDTVGSDEVVGASSIAAYKGKVLVSGEGIIRVC